MEMEVVKMSIQAADYGLTETKAAEISKMFKPMLDTMEELEIRFNDLVNLPRSKEKVLAAKVLFKEYVTTRTGTGKIHREMKAFYLQGGRFVDGWKNAQLMASKSHEETLKEIINFEKIQAKKDRNELKAKRSEL